jgi:hypothetical protein
MMIRNMWRRLSWPMVVAGLTVPWTVNCGLVDGIQKTAKDANPTCSEMDTGDFSQFSIKGQPVVEADVKAFLDASYTFNKIVVDTEASLIASCAAIGKDIGVAPTVLALQPDGGNSGAKVCGAVAAKIGDILKASPGVTLAVNVGTPSCRLDISAVTDCLGVPLDPAALALSCQGGDVGGQCDGDCQGTCSGGAGAGATQSSAGGSAGGHCAGTCTGGCSVAYKAPTCSGDFKPPPGAFSEKKLIACGLKGIAATKCDVPVTITVNGPGSADVQKLVASLQTNLPSIAAIQVGNAPKMMAAAAGVTKAGFDLKSTITKVGIHGGGCVAAGVAKVATASTAIKSNIDASASVSVSLSGGGSLATASK